MGVASRRNGSGVSVLDPVSNGGAAVIEEGVPYLARVTIEGVAPLLFHAWNNEAVAAKGKAPKNSKAKQSDDLESYVYRCPSGNLGIKGEALYIALVAAGRYRQDPRSPRKSAADLLKAALTPLTLLADTGCREWDYVDASRVVVQRAAITRRRPALNQGWRATFEFCVNTPEYVDRVFLQTLLEQAGRLIGIGDHRPTYGRFVVAHFEVLALQ